MSGTTANAGIGGTSRRSLALLALGIAALMLPVHYSFYRYSLVGEGGFYALVHGFLACFFAAVYVLLFFAWVQRLTDAMFQLPILAVLGVVGASVVGLYLLVDLFYGTPVYGLAAIVCLAVSGVCWQACPLAAVRADERLRALPDAATVRVWVPLLADLACYVAAPALFGWLGFDAAAAVGGVLQVSALVLAAVSLVFLAGSLWDMARLAQAASPVSWGRLGGQPASTDDRRRQVCRVLGEEAGLTERETDIMYFLSLGFSVKKIADLLTISANTVATHSSRLYRKLGVHARQEVIDAVDARLGA